MELTWTARGRIQTISESATGDELVRFDWDPLGRRAVRTANGRTLAWSHGGALELDASGAPVAADLGVVRIALDGQHVYRHADDRGNVVMRSDQDGEIRTLRKYDAYGPLETIGEGDDREHGYGLGMELAIDPVLGPVYVMGERVYDPLIGRFLGPDPVPQRINGFVYTLGNPTEFWDPSGRSFDEIDWSQVGAWAIAAGSVLVAGVTCAAAVAEPTFGGEILCAATVGIAAGAIAQAIARQHLDLSEAARGLYPLFEIPILSYGIPRGRVEIHDLGSHGFVEFPRAIYLEL